MAESDPERDDARDEAHTGPRDPEEIKRRLEEMQRELDQRTPVHQRRTAGSGDEPGPVSGSS